MSRAYKVCESDWVLLVGEGNFSFSKDLIDILILNEIKISEKIVCTCREVDCENLSVKEENVKYLLEKVF